MKFIYLLLALLLSVGNVYAAPQRALLIDSSERALGTAANPIVVTGTKSSGIQKTLITDSANTDAWYSGNSLTVSVVSCGGYQFWGGWDTNYHLVLAKRTLNASPISWTTYTYDGTGGRSTITAAVKEYHGGVSLGCDAKGYIHVGLDNHNTALKYRVSLAPYDVSNISQAIPMVGTSVSDTREDSVTYVWFFNKPSDNSLYVNFRDGVAGNGDEFFYSYNLAQSDVPVTADNSTDVFTATSHGMSDNARVFFTATSIPGGITTGQRYFVRDATANTFKVSLTAGGSAIDVTSNGTSVKFNQHYWQPAAGTDTTGGKEGRLLNGTTASIVNSAYINRAPSFDENGILHWTWSYALNTVLYGRIDAQDVGYVKWNGTNFFKYDGNTQTMPITLTNDLPIASVSASLGMSIGNSMDVDSNGNVFSTYVQDDSNGYAQVYVAKLVDGAASTVQLTNSNAISWSIESSISSPRLLIDRRSDTIYILFTSPFDQDGIEVIESHDSFVTWDHYYITTEYSGAGDDPTIPGIGLEIVYDRNLWLDEHTVHIPYQYTPVSNNVYMLEWTPGPDTKINQGGSQYIKAKEITVKDTFTSYGEADFNGYINVNDNSSPIAQWKLNDNAANSTVTDSIGSYSGTAKSGGASINTSTITTTGKISNAFTYTSASSNYTAIASTLGLTNYPMAIEAWFKTSTTGSAQTIFNIADGTVDNKYVDLEITSGNILVFHFRTGGASDAGTATGRTNVCDGAWHHVVATIDSATSMKIFLDGVLEGTSRSSASIGSWPSLTRSAIGRLDRLTPAAYFNGQIDNVRIYNRGISAEEAKQLYAEGNGTEQNITSGVLIVDDKVGIGTNMNEASAKLSVIGGNVGIGTITAPNALYVVGTPMFTTGLNIGIGTTSPTRLCIANNAVATCP